MDLELQNRIDRAQLNDQVLMLGPKPQMELIGLLRQATVMAAPCIVGEDGNQDGLPTVLLEAMALGLPCIATDVTGIPEAIINGITGIIVEQNNAKSLSHALEMTLNDVHLQCALSQQARGLIEERFNIETNTVAIQEIFERNVAHYESAEKGI
jgi:glycosyltransferase involved in cell wall biosynthesis